METSNIHLVYFSATYTTKRILKLIAEQIGDKVMEYDVTRKTLDEDIISENQDLLIVGMPVYAGRIPCRFAVIPPQIQGESYSCYCCVYIW